LAQTREPRKLDFDALDKAFEEIKKSVGEDAIIDSENVLKIPRIPAKSPTLGWILGGGGTPEGRIIEIYGPESAGKSLLAQNIGADYQRAGKFVTYIDAEYSFDPEYANIQGLSVKKDQFRLFQPNTCEDAFTIAEKLASSGQVGLIIMDSLAAMVPQAELEGEMTDQQMGLQARVIGKGLRKLTGILGKTGTTIILINQLRMKIGVMFGNPETTPGGNAPKFYSSIRLDVRRASIDDDGKDSEVDARGIRARVKNIKNKTSIPFRKGELYFSFTEGIAIHEEYLNFAVSYGFIDKKGAWYSYGEERVGQGKDNSVKFLKENLEFFEEIKRKVDERLQGNPAEKITLEVSPVVEEAEKPKRKKKELVIESLVEAALLEGE
jgi:recombination protein RecA